MKKMKTKLPILVLFLLLFLTGCFQIHTEDPDKAFRYWTQIPLSNEEVTVIKGKYRQSGHMTLEYEAYLKMKASEAWKESLIKLNKMTIDSIEWYRPKDVPFWFFPPNDYVKYKSKINNQLFLWEQQDGDTIYIYDFQL